MPAKAGTSRRAREINTLAADRRRVAEDLPARSRTYCQCYYWPVGAWEPGRSARLQDVVRDRRLNLPEYAVCSRGSAPRRGSLLRPPAIGVADSGGGVSKKPDDGIPPRHRNPALTVGAVRQGITGLLVGIFPE